MSLKAQPRALAEGSGRTMSDDDFGCLFTTLGVILYAVGVFLWWAHRLIAWGILFLVRDVLVYLFGDELGAGEEEQFIVLWRIVVPLVLFGAGFCVVLSACASPDPLISWLVTLPLSASAGGLLVYHYNQLYAQHHPKHYTWARFLAAEIKLMSTAKLAWIEETMRWRL